MVNGLVSFGGCDWLLVEWLLVIGRLDTGYWWTGYRGVYRRIILMKALRDWGFFFVLISSKIGQPEVEHVVVWTLEEFVCYPIANKYVAHGEFDSEGFGVKCDA